MKRELSLSLGLAAFALTAAMAQTPSTPTGKIHGHVTNPTGAPATAGTISLSTDGGHSSKYTFPLNAQGDYTGEAAPGTYTIVFRQPDTPADKMVDSIDNIKVIVGLDTMADDDMTRKDFVDKLSPEQKKQLEEIKKHNSEAMKANEIIRGLNTDLRTVTDLIHQADSAQAAAAAELGATASKADLAAKEAEIKKEKYTQVETLMLKDTGAKPDASILWAQLGLAQVGLKKYEEAEATYKKTLELEAASKKPNIAVQGQANAGLGEIYARTGKTQEALDAFDAAAKVDPTKAGFYLKNEAVIFFQLANGDAQVTAADKAIAVDPTQPILYYLKGNGLVQKTTMDEKLHKLVPPAGCMEAYQKYLELAPTGQYAAEVKGIMAGFDMKIDNTYKATKGKK